MMIEKMMHRSSSSPGRIVGGIGEKEAEESVRAIPALRRRMAVVMYIVIFLYAAAFWIQIGVLPVIIYHYIMSVS